MNGIRCPKCDLVNLLNAEICHRCGASLAELPSTAQVSVPPQETYQAQMYSPGLFADFAEDNSVGRRTFFWYRVYCAVTAGFYVLLVIFGLIIALDPSIQYSRDQEEAMVVGFAYVISGGVFGLGYLIALLLPRKPYNWIVGIVVIAFGMTICCFLPAMIPLLIFWLKPETKAHLGRTG